MRRIFAVILTAILLLPALDDALAQEEEWLRIPYKWTVSADLGMGWPMQPGAFADLWNASFPVTIALGYVAIPHIEIKAWLTYAQWGISGIPAKQALQPGDDQTGGDVTEITGGSIKTLLYGGSAKIIPLPKSRIMPYVEIGGGYFQASGDDLEVMNSRTGELSFTNSMEDASGPVLQLALGMEYGVNERWNVYVEVNYYVGFSSDFAPGNLVLPDGAPPVEGSDLQFLSGVLGLVLKI